MPAIEKTFTFRIERDDKAILYISPEDGGDISCMIDTGANVPIWFMGEDYLKLWYPSAYKTEKLTIIHGLGEKPLLDVPVWIIPEFSLTDDFGEVLVFHNLFIPVIEARKFSFNMLMPLTMLNRAKFSFDYKSSATHASFSIESDKPDFYIRPIYVHDNNRYLNRIQAFFEEDDE